MPKKKLTTEAEKVLAAITSDPNGVPRSALTQPLGYLSSTVDAALAELQKAGYPIEVKTVRSGKRGRPATYYCLAASPKTKKAKPAPDTTPVDANISITLGETAATEPPPEPEPELPEPETIPENDVGAEADPDPSPATDKPKKKGKKAN